MSPTHMNPMERTEPQEHGTTLELRGEREVLVTRAFRAPPAVVFDAWTRAELVRRWWAPRALGAEIVECHADVRAGGSYRYVTRGPGGALAFSGTYTELAAPGRLAYTRVFEPMAGAGEIRCEVALEAVAAGTRARVREVYPSKALRDAAVAGGMERTTREALDQLDGLVASLATPTR